MKYKPSHLILNKKLLWNEANFPKANWEHRQVVRLAEDFQSSNHHCDVCGNRIVFGHKVSRDNLTLLAGVGCAGHLTSNLDLARNREELARLKANWTNRRWRVSKAGNHWRHGRLRQRSLYYHAVIYPFDGQFRLRFELRDGDKTRDFNYSYPSLELAKEGVFDQLQDLLNQMENAA